MIRRDLLRSSAIVGLVSSLIVGVLLAPGSFGCAQLAEDLLGEDAGSSTTTTDAATGVSEPDGAAETTVSGDAAAGEDCGIGSTTNVELCTGISICPDIAVDQGVLPGCGFRVRGNTIDLECDCSGQLCPIGAPTTCGEATQLLQNQTSASVCLQISEGHCTTPGTSESSSSGSTASSTCDKTCEANCAGAPTCIEACGC